jgi:hypothetical protein
MRSSTRQPADDFQYVLEGGRDGPHVLHDVRDWGKALARLEAILRERGGDWVLWAVPATGPRLLVAAAAAAAGPAVLALAVSPGPMVFRKPLEGGD